MERSVNRTSM